MTLLGKALEVEPSGSYISFIADELQISDLKARKLLITAGERDKHIYYSSPLSDQVQGLRAKGKTVKEIEQVLQISHASVIGYLPISRTIYGMRELSADAIRIQRYRERQRVCQSYMDEIVGLNHDAEEEYLCLVISSFCYGTIGEGLKATHLKQKRDQLNICENRAWPEMATHSFAPRREGLPLGCLH